MKVALISPKGPLYRSTGGIFRKSLRYQPLTLTTLASLAPPELDIQFQLLDEGTGNVPLDLDADLVGMTVITGSSMRAYELAAHYRRRGIKVVLGGPHVTLMPDEARAARRCHLHRLRREILARAAARLFDWHAAPPLRAGARPGSRRHAVSAPGVC